MDALIVTLAFLTPPAEFVTLSRFPDRETTVRTVNALERHRAVCQARADVERHDPGFWQAWALDTDEALEAWQVLRLCHGSNGIWGTSDSLDSRLVMLSWRLSKEAFAAGRMPCPAVMPRRQYEPWRR